jgi:hypothetical protein
VVCASLHLNGAGEAVCVALSKMDGALELHVQTCVDWSGWFN